MVATSLDAAEDSAIDADGMPLIWISSKNESDKGWCKGARLRQLRQLCFLGLPAAPDCHHLSMPIVAGHLDSMAEVTPVGHGPLLPTLL